MNLWQKMNNAQRITIIMAVLYIGLDIWLDATDQQTFSQMILEVSGRDVGWIVPMVIGVCLGHFFWPQRRKG